MQLHLMVTKLWQRTKKTLKFRQSKGNSSSVTDDTLSKLQVHNPIIVICIQYKCHEITSIGYLVMAEGRKTDKGST